MNRRTWGVIAAIAVVIALLIFFTTRKKLEAVSEPTILPPTEAQPVAITPVPISEVAKLISMPITEKPVDATTWIAVKEEVRGVDVLGGTGEERVEAVLRQDKELTGTMWVAQATLRETEAAASPQVAVGQAVYMAAHPTEIIIPGAEVAAWWAVHPTGRLD